MLSHESSPSTSILADRLIVFTKFPEPGQVKTRLIPALGALRAAQFQEAMTQHTLSVAKQFCAEYPCDLEVCFTGGNVASICRLYGNEFRYSLQEGNNLGERLMHAVSVAFAEGGNRVVVIGTDCPEISPSLLTTAFRALSPQTIVLGPATDGGYYLIGMGVRRPELFQGIDWSTENVLRQTLEIARLSRCGVHQLIPLADVDTPEDLWGLPGAVRILFGVLSKSTRERD